MHLIFNETKNFIFFLRIVWAMVVGIFALG